MGKPYTKDLNLPIGDHESWTFSLDSPEGSDLDLSGYADIIMKAYDQWGGTLLFEKSMTNGSVTVTNAAQGQFRVDVTPTDTNTVTLPKGRRRVDYRYRIQVVTGTGAKVTVVQGRLFLYAS